MRNPDRIPEVLDAIADEWYDHPDQRLGQLIWNLSGNQDPFSIEDDELVDRCGHELECNYYVGENKLSPDYRSMYRSEVMDNE